MDPTRSINQCRWPSFLQPSAFSKTGEWLESMESFEKEKDRDCYCDERCCRIIFQIFQRCLACLGTVVNGLWDILIWSRVTVTPGGIDRVGRKNHICNLISALASPIFAIFVLFGYYPKPSLRGASYRLEDHLLSAIYRKDAYYITKFRERIGRLDPGFQFFLLKMAIGLPQNPEVLSALIAIIPEQDKRRVLSQLLLYTCTKDLNHISTILAEQGYYGALDWQVTIREMPFLLDYHATQQLNQEDPLPGKLIPFLPFLLFSESLQLSEEAFEEIPISNYAYRILRRVDNQEEYSRKGDRALAIIRNLISSGVEFRIDEVEQAVPFYQQLKEHFDKRDPLEAIVNYKDYANSFEASIQDKEHAHRNVFFAWALSSHLFPGSAFKRQDPFIFEHPLDIVLPILQRILEKRKEIEQWQKEAATERGKTLLPRLPPDIPPGIPSVIAGY